MTVVDPNQPQPQRQPRPEPQTARAHVDQVALTRADQARTDAHRVAALVQIAREGHGEARDHGEDAHRLREAIDVLYDRIASKPGDRRVRLDRALHDMSGSLDEEAVLEYLDLTGREGMTARSALQRILDRRTFPEFDGGQEFSDRLHSLAHTWEQGARAQEAAVRPALPAAAPASPAPLPRREPPIAPALPPMVPPAPPESPAEQTGQIFAALRGKGYLISSDMEAAARKDHQSGLTVAAPDPAFAATALPQARVDDTQVMSTDQVLAHLGMDDASVEASKPEQPVVPPFVSAAGETGGASRSAAASGSGDDDD
jgi:hypothetical protein